MMKTGALLLLCAASMAAQGMRGTAMQVIVATTYTLTFPSGTAAGDLGVIFAAQGFGLNTGPSGWTQVTLNASGSWNAYEFYKVLTSTDISAGSAAVTFSGSYDGVAAIVTFIGDPGTPRSPYSSGSSPLTITTNQVKDEGLYFLSNRGSSLPASISPGTVAQACATTGANATGCFYVQAITSSASYNVSFTLTGGSSGATNAVILVPNAALVEATANQSVIMVGP